MSETQIMILLVAEILFVVLFFYVLYLVGGTYQNVKKILQRLDNLEKKFEKPATYYKPPNQRLKLTELD